MAFVHMDDDAAFSTNKADNGVAGNRIAAARKIKPETFAALNNQRLMGGIAGVGGVAFGIGFSK